MGDSNSLSYSSVSLTSHGAPCYHRQGYGDRVASGIRSPPIPNAKGLFGRRMSGYRIRTPSCPWGGKLPLQAEEPLGGQWCRMWKVRGNHHIKDPRDIPRRNSTFMDFSQVKFSSEGTTKREQSRGQTRVLLSS